jgi:serpin B
VLTTRRDTLRALGLAGLAGSPLLAACGAHSGAGAAPDRPAAALELVAARVARSAGDAAGIPDTVTALGRFTGDLWRAIGEPGANLVLSPYSVVVALAMTANGAVGQTRGQMTSTLDVGSLAGFNAGMAALTQAVEGLAGPVTLPGGGEGEIALASANQLFGDRRTVWEQAFLTVLAKEYGAGMRTVDFRGHAEGARALINAWTSDRTHDRIPTILPPGAVDALTRLVLVNALYLKAPWATPFQKQATTSQPFHRADGSRVDVAMMDGQPAAGVYLTGEHYVGARLPYTGAALAMTVAVPEAGHEDDVLAALLDGGLTAPGEGGLHVRLPTFTFRVPTDLKPLLGRLGMPLAFGDRADFSAMTTSERLHVSAVLHEAFIAVDENGTEAAAATAVVMGATSATVSQHDLVCDRPFLFVLHDAAYGTPLFVGRVADPSGG